MTITWPDGLTEIFDLTPAEGSTFFPGLTSAEFTGRPNTTSELEALDTSLFYSNGDLLGGTFGSGGVYDPTQFRLTDRFGTEYLIDTVNGLTEMRDRSGNTLTITGSGITSSFGPGVTFERDASGRVTRAVGPDGEDILYGYDANGDLVSVTDQRNNVTTLTYLADHFLDQVIDPLNRPFTTFEYDADGRLAFITDGEGNRTAIVADAGARTETVTDAEQKLVTVSTFDERGNLVRLDEVFDGQTQTTTFGYDGLDNLVSRLDPSGNTWSATYDGRDLVSFTEPGSDGTPDTIDLVYDEFGFPLTWTDQNSEITTYVWNADGTLAEIVDADLNAETYTYYPDGNRESRTDRENNTWTWTYTADGMTETETDPNGNVTTFSYDNAGRVLDTIDATGVNSTVRSYDTIGNLRFETDRDDVATEWQYDKLNRLTQRIVGGRFTTTWTYDDAGRVTSVDNGVDAPTTYTYDKNGRVATIAVGDLAPTVFAYDGAGRLVAETDPVDRMTSYGYYPNGWLRTTTNPAGGVTENFFYPDGSLQRTEDPFDNPTSYTYDGAGRTKTVTDPVGRVTSYDYDPVGRLVTTTFNDGSFTENVYDLAGRLVGTYDQERQLTEFGYDGAGNRTLMTDPELRETTFVFDELNRLERSIAPDLGETVYGYSPAGRMESITTAEGVTTGFGYDSQGLQTSRTDGLGNTWTTSYNDTGRVLSETDARQNATASPQPTTVNAYDPAGRLASISDVAGNSVSFGYNPAGERTSVTDPRNKTWSFTFDALGGVATETDPLLNTQTWVYDIEGRLDSYTDGRGVTVDYGYFADDRVQSVTEQGGTGSILYTYDGVGRRDTMSDETGVTDWDYYSDGAVQSVTAPAGTVAYTYDGSNRRTSMSQPEGQVSYGYDPAGRLASITDWNTDQTTLTYDTDGRIEAMARPNGVTSAWTYDVAGRLDRIDHATSSGIFEFFDYTLDANGNRTAVASTAGSESYQLNELNQLTSVIYPDSTGTTFTYDPAGNRSTSQDSGAPQVNYAYDDASRLTTVGGTVYTYDGQGNQLTAGTTSYTWDWQNRLATVTDGATTTSFGYDGDAVRTLVDGQAQLFDRNGWSGLPELISGGSTAFLHSPEGVLAQIEASTEFVVSDALGSIRAVTDSTGTTVGTSEYAVFGDPRTTTGTSTSFGFTGAQQANDLVYLNARYLSPVVGSFLAVDPVRPGAPSVAGWNPYSYVANNPTTWTDPSGEVATLERVSTQEISKPARKPLIPIGIGVAAIFCAVATILSGGPCGIGGDEEPEDRLPQLDPSLGNTPLPETVPNPSPPDTDDDRNDCRERATEMAASLPAVAWAIYTSTQFGGTVGAERNVAAVSYCISETLGLSAAVSGTAVRPGLVPNPDIVVFPPKTGGENDAEWKIVNQLYATYQDGTPGSVAFIYSQFKICPSCAGAIDAYGSATFVEVAAWDSGFTREEFVTRFGGLR